jgi:CubicO group peptidase (beta-lactamase class C family)
VAAIFIVALFFIPFSYLFSDGFAPALAADAVDDSPLAKLVAEQRKESRLVGLAAMVMVDGKVTASAAGGERKRGSKARVELADRWHVGSITKSITATMIARLVEADKLQWTDTLGEVFADETIHDDWKSVTLHELLTHTSGAPPNFSKSTQFNQPKIGKPAAEARRTTVLSLLANPPATPPGKKMVYSNVGFTIAGAMAEEATGESWSDLVKREVFEPLQLTTAGFGPPKSDVDENGSKRITQPQGHTKLFGWKLAAGEDADNTAIIGPAGIAHMSLVDLCTYATEHLRGDQGQGQLLSAETYQRLHTPNLDDYAYGWVQRDARGKFFPPFYWHNGSNTMWYALVVFVPSTNKVIAVTSNDGDIAKAEAAAWKIVTAETVTVPMPEEVTALLKKLGYDALVSMKEQLMLSKK